MAAYKTSVEGAVKTMKSIAKGASPTEELSDREKMHFDAIISSREMTTWSRNDLFLVTQLARMNRRMEDLSNIIDEVGYTQVNDRGTTVSNPAFSAMMQVQNTIQSLTKTLGLSAPQRGLNGPEQRQRNKADATAREVIDRVAGGDGLLA